MKEKDQKILDLRKELDEYENEIEGYKRNMSEMHRKMTDQMKKVEQIQAELVVLEKQSVKITITDHAILRYLERVEGVNRKEIEQRILRPEILCLINKLGGSGTYPGTVGFSVCMKNGVVKTIKKLK
jgi:uncharacterized coiled-coil DUF342 family protein